ncbi:MAG: undecaprenyldiphospho-muramoylpentapeptide beta-N-acetylglucosaminyltransferase [Candidatus Rokuibacteriota bacterium]|nr:MAG: undecaprenyldiphospho-muramoylpentapeptide beta-N-acetylglucosaminyltransferase [Candidatus Rokubacteria bacterium]
MTPIILAGGGTGGHTSPALAVAALLRQRNVAHAWIGSRDGVEAHRAAEQAIPYFAIPTGKLRRYWAWRNVTDLALNVPAGVVRAHGLLRRLRPRVVLATGGFVALPVVLGAALARVPVVVHEQTAVPGLANRIAARLARRIALTFAESDRHFPPGRIVVTGNPLRPDLRSGSRADAVARFGLDPALPLVYVTGGAQGAHAINRAVGEIIGDLLGHAQVVHQSGDNPATGDFVWLQTRRAALPPALARRYTVLPWVGAELGDIYATAALVVTRAGAGTVNECCQLGLPALYIPLPGARGDEQTANARLVGRAGGCAILPQATLTPGLLLARVRGLLAEPARLKEMGERARTLAIPDAADRLVALLMEFVA